MRRVLTGATALALVLPAATAAPVAAKAAQPSLQHMTMIGDSVAASINYTAAAQQVLESGDSVDLELASCRRLWTQSCASPPPPSMLQLVESLGHRLGLTVVVSIGYNDSPTVYQGGLPRTLRALRDAGVRHVLWLTLRAAQHGYLQSNAEIRAAAATRPWMTVVDWNRYSRSHPDWFQSDGIHLVAAGAAQMAILIHRTLVKMGLTGSQPRPLVILPLKIPWTTSGSAYRVRLHAAGGRGPYSWKVVGRLPHGLQMNANGVVSGTARLAAGRYLLRVELTDRLGASVETKLPLHVVRGSRQLNRGR